MPVLRREAGYAKFRDRKFTRRLMTTSVDTTRDVVISSKELLFPFWKWFNCFEGQQGISIMDDSNWANLNPKNTILFLGSGFSMEATNKTGNTFLDGNKLAKHLQKVFGDEDRGGPTFSTSQQPI